MAYCTKTQVKAYLGVSVTTDDTLIDDLITRAQAWIEHSTNRAFEYGVAMARQFDAERDVSSDQRTLYLDLDLCSITSVVNGDGTTVAAADYVTEPRDTTPYHALRLTRGSGLVWTWDTTPEEAITITGKWAFSASAPADVVHACIRLTAFLYKQKDKNSAIPDAPRVSADGVVMLPLALPKDVEALLAPLVRR